MIRRHQIEALTGRRVRQLQPLHGGDLSEVLRIDFDSGPSLVGKTGPLVATEAAMLRALAPFAAPVIAASNDLLLLPYMPEEPAKGHHWRDLGQQLRQLHGRQAPDHGWPENYAFGPVPIHNEPCQDWPAFYAAQRLRPALPNLPPDLARRLERLCRMLPDRLPRLAAHLLHGDLWRGNLLFSDNRAHLIDPACYYGDPEVDLAMLCLFGTPPDSFWDGYGAPKSGIANRQPIYQLWPALVHLRLFGRGYLPLVDQLLTRSGV